MIIKGKGFTLIELILVLILISILGALGVGLFSAPSQYSPGLAQQQWLNQINFAERQALLKQSSSQLILTVNRTSSAWQFVLSQGSNTLDTFEIEHKQQDVYFSQSDFSTECTNLSKLSFPFVIRFNGMGNQVNASGQVNLFNTRICFDQAHGLCIGPSGLAYGGNCVP